MVHGMRIQLLKCTEGPSAVPATLVAGTIDRHTHNRVLPLARTNFYIRGTWHPSDSFCLYLFVEQGDILNQPIITLFIYIHTWSVGNMNAEHPSLFQ